MGKTQGEKIDKSPATKAAIIDICSKDILKAGVLTFPL